MKKLQLLTGSLLVCLAVSTACKEEEYVYPDVITEFIDAGTDAEGSLQRLITDNGKTLEIQKRDGLDGLDADTIYRTVSVYTLQDNNEAYLYSAQLVLSMIPVATDYFKDEIKTDPTDIRSIWQSGNYLNMILTPLVKDQSHAFHFVNHGITENNEKQILHLELYHDRNNDLEAFSKEVYLSVPLWAYRNELQQNDSVFFEINTYKQGKTVYKFLYPEIHTY